MNKPIHRKADASFIVAMATLLLVIQAFLLPAIGLSVLVLMMSGPWPNGVHPAFFRYFAPAIVGAPLVMAGVILAIVQKRAAALAL
jgi:hypothetical protein